MSSNSPHSAKPSTSRWPTAQQAPPPDPIIFPPPPPREHTQAERLITRYQGQIILLILLHLGIVALALAIMMPSFIALGSVGIIIHLARLTAQKHHLL